MSKRYIADIVETVELVVSDGAVDTYIAISDADGKLVWTSPTAYTNVNHNLLSDTHTDTLTGTVARGSLIIGNSTPKWSELAFPSTPTGKVLVANATDIVWSTNALGTMAWETATNYIPKSLGTTTGDLISFSTTSTPFRIADVSVGSYLRSGGVGVLPLWSTLKLPNSGTAYKLAAYTSTNTLGELAAVGANGEYLKGNTSGLPTWVALSSGTELLPTGTEGQTLYNNGGTWTVNSGIIWDDTNGRVGIGTTNPQQKLDVSGKIALDGTTIAYRPTAFTGTLILGDGGSNLQTGSDYNTFVGIGAGASNTTGSYNTANGYASLYSNTEGNSNTANGYYSLYSNTTGSQNTANGMYSLYSNTTGQRNTANGYYSLYSNTTGSYNTANGFQSLYSNTTGINNTANGFQSLYSNTTGSYNTANGFQSLHSNTTGSQNTANGYQAGRYIADGATANGTGSNSLFLGYDTRANADGETNQIVIGANAIGNGSNTATIGDDNVTDLYAGEDGQANIHINGLYDSSDDPGTSGQILSSTATGTNWITFPTIPDVSITDNYVAVGTGTGIEGSNTLMWDRSLFTIKGTTGVTLRLDTGTTDGVSGIEFWDDSGSYATIKVNLETSGGGLDFAATYGFNFSTGIGNNLSWSDTILSATGSGSLILKLNNGGSDSYSKIEFYDDITLHSSIYIYEGGDHSGLVFDSSAFTFLTGVITAPAIVLTTGAGLNKVLTSDASGVATWQPPAGNSYTLPLATDGTRGGIQIGFTATEASLPLLLSSEKAYITLSKSSIEYVLTGNITSHTHSYTNYAEPGIFSGGGTPTLATGVTSAEVRSLISAEAALGNPGTTGYVLSSTTAGVRSWVAQSGGANTALSNLASVAINAALLPGTTNSIALGSASYFWSDLFLGSGSIINWNNDVTLTHSANLLTFAGGDVAVNGVTTAGGSMNWKSVEITTTNTTIGNDAVVVYLSPGRVGFNTNLPALIQDRVYFIRNTSTTDSVTVTPFSGDTIDGSTSAITLAAQTSLILHGAGIPTVKNWKSFINV